MTFVERTFVTVYGETVALQRVDRGSLTYEVIRSTGEKPGQYTRLNSLAYECVATSWRDLTTKQCPDPITAVRWIIRRALPADQLPTEEAYPADMEWWTH